MSYLRDFRHVIDREKAAVGCFMTLDPAPAHHRADAKTAGVVHVRRATVRPTSSVVDC